MPVFDYSICMACNSCVSVCPISCLEASKTDVDYYKKAYPQLGTYNDCTGCSICSKECPIDAITMVAADTVKAA